MADYATEAQEILPGLFLGPLVSAQRGNPPVDAVLTVMEAPLEPEAVAALGEGCYLHLPVDESQCEGDEVPFDELRAFVQGHLDAGRRVLVHCCSGVRRSGTTVLAYVMLSRGCSLREAFALVAEARPVIMPSAELYRSLVRLEGATATEEPSLSEDEYAAYGLRAILGGARPVSECLAALRAAGGNPDMAFASLV